MIDLRITLALILTPQNELIGVEAQLIDWHSQARVKPMGLTVT